MQFHSLAIVIFVEGTERMEKADKRPFTAEINSETFRHTMRPETFSTPSDYTQATSSTEEIDSVNEFIRKIHHGISRKYSQHYLALHWFLNNDSRWLPGDLFYACLRSVPISLAKILDFVSPRKLHIGRFEDSRTALVEVSV